ncbi:amidohydrolase family protein [Solihabitans fulvus]|uniref:Amidohydrolase family protein n=1 Tax=Solihabitans fulvus TaxID=1892852 RepID=A0A5B2WPG0_9PSEU|nr:amidohydrolase family protein [Solihabitans fulvus]KAA2253843.1 amidohydrolase family protein [Solihabitans fulvus]
MAITPHAQSDAEAGRTALRDVRVFDGRELSPPRTVVIDGGVIGTDASGARVVEAGGAVLLPGLIDAHIHLYDRDSLRRLRDHGVTTGLDMATWSLELLASLRGIPGLTDIRSAGTAALGPGGQHAKFPGVPADAIVLDPEQARRFVDTRVAEGSDYLKIVAEAPGQGGPDQSVLDALTAAAHAHGRKVVVHATNTDAYSMARAAGADLITHAPLDRPLSAEEAAAVAAEGRVVIPTLTMMEGVAAATGRSFAAATGSVAALHRAGVPILAGTDANSQPGVPFQVAHGESLHHELELLVAAGLSTLDALRAATVLPARHFGLDDRGAIEPGLRADLVLVDGDPLADIRATRAVRTVWCGGVEHSPT